MTPGTNLLPPSPRMCWIPAAADAWIHPSQRVKGHHKSQEATTAAALMKSTGFRLLTFTHTWTGGSVCTHM